MARVSSERVRSVGGQRLAAVIDQRLSSVGLPQRVSHLSLSQSVAEWGEEKRPRELEGLLVGRAVPKQGCDWSVAEGVALDVQRGYVHFAGEMVARCHRLDLGRDRIAEKLACYVDNRRRSLVEHPNRTHCLSLNQSTFISPFPVHSRGHPFAVAC